MKRLSMYAQVNILKVITHSIAILGIYFFPMPLMYWLPISIAGYFIFTRLGSDAGFHRLFTHKSFRTSPAIESILLILGTLDCKGSMFSWVVSHEAHHAYTERKGDPHSPWRIGWFNVWFLNWEKFPVMRREIGPYLKRPLFRACHDYYLLIILSFIVILASIDLRVLIYFWALPMVYSIHMTGLVNTIGHSIGYRNFDSNDKSHNNLLLNIFSLGGGLHNNHHGQPRAWNTSTNLRWHEFDPAAWVIRLLRTSS